MKKKLLLFHLILMAFITLKSQDIFVAVYEGTVKFPDGRTLEHNLRYPVPKTGNVVFEEGSRSVVFTKDKAFDVVPDNDQGSFNFNDIKKGLSYNDFRNKFQKMIAKNQSGILNYMYNLHMYHQLEETGKGAVTAGVKGIDDGLKKERNKDNETVSPQDSVKLLSNSIQLKWKAGSTIFGSKLIVINTAANDTIYNQQPPETGLATVQVDKEGVYRWLIYSSLEKKKIINRVFIKPADAETKAITDNLNKFKEQVNMFEEELRSLIIEDYLYQNRIIEN